MHSLARNLLLLFANSGLPVDIDFSALADGDLPATLLGSTWAISSGAAVNTPTLGSELLADGGLEATYTSGLCDSLAKYLTPTVAQSADVHGGSKAQEFTGTAAGEYVYFTPLNQGSSGDWHILSAYVKRTAGTTGYAYLELYQGAALPIVNVGMVINSASYVQCKVGLICGSGSFFRRVVASSASSDTVLLDDASDKVISYGTLFAMLPATQADVIVKAVPDSIPTGDATLWGLTIRADDRNSPTNAIFVIAHRHELTSTLINISVVKKIGSTYTSIQAESSVTFVTNAYLEARISGDILQIYYNNVQVGSDITVSDSELASNQIHGMFSSGGASFLRFFAQAN